MRFRQGADAHLFAVSNIFNSLSVPGLTKLGQAADWVKAPTSYSLRDDWSLIRGRHTIKAGVEIKQVNYNYSQASETLWCTRFRKTLSTTH